MDVEGIELVNSGAGGFFGGPGHLVLDKARIGDEHLGGVLALGEYSIQKILDLKSAHLMDGRGLQSLRIRQVFFLFCAGGFDFLNGRRRDGGQFQYRHAIPFEQLGQGRFVESLAAEPGGVLDEEIIDAIAKGAVGFGHARGRGRIIRRKHENGYARFANIERIKHAQGFHSSEQEVGRLCREIGHRERRVGQVHDELQELVIGSGGINKCRFGKAFAEGFVLGIAIDGGDGYSGEPRPGEDAFKDGGLANASTGLKAGN
jgi:hypothetical protein